MSGDLRQGLQTLVKCIRDQNQFLADKLQVVLHDKSTPTVARIILGEVKQYFVFTGRLIMMSNVSISFLGSNVQYVRPKSRSSSFNMRTLVNS